MRARLAWLFIVATTGCTQDNPAFDDSAGTAGTTTDDEPTTTASTLESESNSGQEAPEPVCELQPGEPLEIDLGSVLCTDTPEIYDRLHKLVSIDGSTLLVGSCPVGALDCSQCPTLVQTPLSFHPLDLTGIAAPDECLRVQARRVNPDNPDVCAFQSVAIEAQAGLTRRPIMIGRNAPGIGLPAVDNASPLAGFEPTLVYDESCSCAEFPESCCEQDERTRYAFGIGLTDPVPIGGTAMLEFPNDSYAFKTLNAFQSGVCDEPIQEAWALIAK
jgi:hypothetical protein